MDKLQDLIAAKFADSEFGQKYAFWKKQREQQRQEDLRNLPDNCAFLGITYTGDEEQIAKLGDITAAANKKRDCDACAFDVMTCNQCKHNSQSNRLLAVCNTLMPSCSKYETWERNERQKAAIQRCLDASGLSKRFLTRRFGTFKRTADTATAYDRCRDFCEHFTFNAQGLRLVGGYGCGKTHLAAAIIQDLAQKGIGGMFVVVPELLQAIRRSFNGKENSTLIDTAIKAPLLVLDDLGAEKPTEWVQEQLYVIINRRYEDMLPTIITTNCTMQELTDRVGQRISSRLVEMTSPIKITAKDYRLEVARGAS